MDLNNGDGVRSADVRDDTLDGGGLGAVDLAPDSVGTSEVADGSLGALDLAPDSVTSSEAAADSIGTSEVANGSLTRDDINEPSLFVMGQGGLRDCSPETSTFIACGSVTLTLPVQSDVLVNASGGFDAIGVGADEGRCMLSRGTSAISGFSTAITVGQNGNEHNTFDRKDGFSRTGVDSNVPSGTTTWQLRCNRGAGDITFGDIQLTALALAN